jgi:hypothetical protein
MNLLKFNSFIQYESIFFKVAGESYLPLNESVYTYTAIHILK